MTKSAAQRMAEKAAAAAAAAAGQQTPAAPATDNTLAVDREHLGLRTTPVRSTVDLPPVQHHKLKDWCSEAAIMIGKSRVTTQDVMRALVARLLEDETLAREIRSDLRK